MKPYSYVQLGWSLGLGKLKTDLDFIYGPIWGWNYYDDILSVSGVTL